MRGINQNTARAIRLLPKGCTDICYGSAAEIKSDIPYHEDLEVTKLTFLQTAISACGGGPRDGLNPWGAAVAFPKARGWRRGPVDSLGLDVRRLHDFPPALQLRVDVSGENVGRAAHDLHGHGGKPLAQIGLLECAVDLGVERRHDSRGCRLQADDHHARQHQRRPRLASAGREKVFSGF